MSTFSTSSESEAELATTGARLGSKGASSTGMLIVNADDWGRTQETTTRIYECIRCGSVSSASAMVFMEDSERSATVARQFGVDVGLHLNLTSPFSSSKVAMPLVEHQNRVALYLRSHRLAPAMFHPGLVNSFEYVTKAQLEEFGRLYGSVPRRIDGHHHMHLSSNVLLAGLLPYGSMARRNFTFQAGEKSLLNRLYRTTVDRFLARRHHLTDLFFALPPLVPSFRLQKIFSLAAQFSVELETHPVNPDEYRFLTEGAIFRLTGELQIASRYDLISTRDA